MKKALLTLGILYPLFMFGQTVNQQQIRQANIDYKRRADSIIGLLTLEEKVSQLKYNADAIPRLDIPAYNWWNEALHGIARAGNATVFPQAIGLAASFDPELTKEIASAIADEGRAKFHASIEQGVRLQYTGITYWTPNVNIFRDPRWGRGQETYGEDPLLTSRLGVAFVEGLQGDHPKYLKSAACAKHFAVHSGPEGLRHEFDATTNMKDLHETYLPAFKELVNANVEAVMCAYNRVNTVPCCANGYLINILKNEWGFSGHMLSDCWALQDFHNGHNYTSTEIESAALAANSGISLNCGSAYQNSLLDAANQGKVSEETIDKLLKPLILTKLKLGLFDPLEDNPYYTANTQIINCSKHVALSYEAATKSIVLLKNNGVLPLSNKIPFLYVNGPNAASVDALLGNYYGTSKNMVTVIEGLTDRISVGSKLQYNHGFLLYEENINPIDWASGIVNEADATVVVMGLNGILEGEEGDALASEAKGDMFDLSLPKNQVNFLKKMREQTDKPLIVVLIGGSPVVINEVHELADAVLWAWYPGEQGGNAIADIIFGNISPSGKLPITFVKSVDDLPDYEDYSMEGRTYKYMNKEPLYPFGFGLTYSKTEISDIEVEQKKVKQGDSVVVVATIKNTGKTVTEDVIQLYASHKNIEFRTPINDLKDFKRIKLEPGQSRTLTFEISSEQLMVIDMDGVSQWIPSEVELTIGNSSPGERSLELGSAAYKKTTIKLVK